MCRRRRFTGEQSSDSLRLLLTGQRNHQAEEEDEEEDVEVEAERPDQQWQARTATLMLPTSPRSKGRHEDEEEEEEEELKQQRCTRIRSRRRPKLTCAFHQAKLRREPYNYKRLLTCASIKRAFGLLLAGVCMIALASEPARALSYSNGNWQSQQQSIAGLQQSMAQLLQVFNGNESQQLEANHFKLMERTGDFLLLGARNVVYNLSLSTMREQRRLEWPSTEEDVRMCRMKGKSPEQCQNYIRVVKLQAPNTLYVCGTNAYKPRCRTYLVTSNAYELVTEAPGEGACPYQENQNITSLVVDGELYSATAAQFSGIDGLIHRPPLRTEQFNPKQLNSPNFVSSFKYGEHVYFLFRESAIEYTNCGKAIYSRIARVCINDSGGQTRANRERWTSFVKARLNCSIPGEFPFYFDEIQASTHIVSSPSMAPTAGVGNQPFGSLDPQQMAQQSLGSNPSTDLLYAVFTTPANSIGGSAVCAYRMSDILAAFDGPFKSQADGNSNWLPVPESRVPQPRPGTCVNDSKQLPDENINFIKDNPLMDTAVEAIWSQPLIMMASINFRFTQIAVDTQVETQLVPGASQLRTDVIFVATDDGRVFKLINTHHLLAAAAATGSTATQQQGNRYAAGQQSAYSREPTYMAGSARDQHPGFGSLHRAAHLQQQQQQQQQQQLPIAAAQVLAAGPANVPAAREPVPDVSSSTVVIEELHLFDSRTPILSLLVYYPSMASSVQMNEGLESSQQGQVAAAGRVQYPKLVVVSGKQLKAIPLSRCERALSCADCLALYDPYCAWDIRQQACLALGRSMAPQQQQQQSPFGTAVSQLPPSYSSLLRQSPHLLSSGQTSSGWFPPNNLAPPNNHTLAWWSQCPAVGPNGQLAPQQAVGVPYRSLFSSHFQVPSRFDYQSGHYLSHTALVALSAPLQPSPQVGSSQQAPPGGSGQGLPTSNSGYRNQQQPVSECLTFCGGLHTPLMQQQHQHAGSASLFAASSILSPASTSDQSSSSFVSNCADYVQQHYIGNLQPGSAFIGGSLIGQQGANGGSAASANNTSEKYYFAVIICAVSGLILGLVFGFTLGRNTRKHDSSICSSTFDETNLYMASTGSHHGANLFAQLQQQQRLHHPLLQQATGNGSGAHTNGGSGVTAALLDTVNGINRNSMAHHQQQQASNNHQHLYDSAINNGCVLQEQGNYGNHPQQQQQLLMHLANGGAASVASNATISHRSGALPPVPSQQQQAPLINTNSAPSTQINHSQLTPNSINGASNNSHHAAGMLSGGSTSSTNTSSTSATVPASEHHQAHQLYLNQQQLMMQQQPNNNNHHHQRSFSNNGSNNSSITKGTTNNTNSGKLSNGKNTFLQQQQQQLQHLQQQQNKIYL